MGWFPRDDSDDLEGTGNFLMICKTAAEVATAASVDARDIKVNKESVNALGVFCERKTAHLSDLMRIASANLDPRGQDAIQLAVHMADYKQSLDDVVKRMRDWRSLNPQRKMLLRWWRKGDIQKNITTLRKEIEGRSVKVQRHLADLGLLAPDGSQIIQQLLVPGDLDSHLCDGHSKAEASHLGSSIDLGEPLRPVVEMSLTVPDKEGLGRTTPPALGLGDFRNELRHLFIDRQQIVVDEQSFLGRGGFGVVQKATLVSEPSKVLAAKQLISVDEQKAKRLIREIKIWSALDHPNVLRLTGFFLSDELDSAMLLCPWEPAGDIKNYLAKRPIDLDHRIKLVSQTLDAVRYLHTRQPPVVHGDLKAQNTLLSGCGEAVLCDFGLANIVSTSEITTSVSLQGSIPWCSPEVLNGSRKSLASDVWAWGCLVLEIMKGVVPYHRVSTQGVGHLLQCIVMAREPPALQEALQEPFDLWRLLQHCWHYEAKDRINATQCLEGWNALVSKSAQRTIRGHICPPIWRTPSPGQLARGSAPY